MSSRFDQDRSALRVKIIQTLLDVYRSYSSRESGAKKRKRVHPSIETRELIRILRQIQQGRTSLTQKYVYLAESNFDV